MAGAGSGSGSGGKGPHGMAAYEHIAVIGKGSFGTVSKVRRRSDNRILVWKELNYGHMREKEKQLVVSEVNILRELRHPFVVRYYDRIIDKATTKIYIVMEHCEGGDLGRVIRKCRKEGAYLDEELIWKFCTQIVLALKECHRHKENGVLKPILHRDIKPGNILLDQHRNVKLADFGLAKELKSQSKFARTNVGTPFYMSPEMINSSRYNEKSDIWAVGCLLYELAALRPPFEASNHLSLAMKINQGSFARIPSRYSDSLFNAIRSMMNTDQSKRPTVEQLEMVPQVRRYARDACLAVRECQLNHNYAVKLRALRQREDELARRAKDLDAKAARLAELEASLNRQAAAAQGSANVRPSTAPTATVTAPGDGPVDHAQRGTSHRAASTGHKRSSSASSAPASGRGRDRHAPKHGTTTGDAPRDPVGASIPLAPHAGANYVGGSKPVRKAWAAPRTMSAHGDGPTGASVPGGGAAPPLPSAAYGHYAYQGYQPRTRGGVARIR